MRQVRRPSPSCRSSFQQPPLDNARTDEQATEPRPVPGSEAPPAVTQSPSFARLRKLAEDGDAQAQFSLGRIYEKGQGITQDHAEALRCGTWQRLRDRRQNAHGGCAANRASALRRATLRRCAGCGRRPTRGLSSAQANPGIMYLRDTGYHPEPCRGRSAGSRRPPTKGGHQCAILSRHHASHGPGRATELRITLALSWFRETADRANPQGAARAIAAMYEKGQGMPRKSRRAGKYDRPVFCRHGVLLRARRLQKR